MSKTRVGIINVTGYVGIELARILCQHPEVDLVSITGRSAAGQKIGKVFPSLIGLDMTIESRLGDVDLAFSAMPHGESAAEVMPLVKSGKRVVDMSGDFRLKDAAVWQFWYGHVHPDTEMLTRAVYGIPELHGAEIRQARLVANPGCYSTGAILALAPAARAGIIEPDIVVDSKSGVSGAGRTLKLTSHFCEADEDVCAYSTEGHRLMPEMVQELGLLSPGPAPKITFMPHLIPMNRGILSACYANLKMDKLGGGNPKDAVRKLYRDFYAATPFVKVVDEPPHTKHVQGSNYTHIYLTVDSRTGKLIVLSVIDNLGKGAAGQGVQNMNVMLGLPETCGLSMPGMFP
ncbi:MAG TPA: N-acetyl-gamma-glutamyl-phosphate reductase [Dehalococcoidales bacterium]|nr:N-acetyl-gamma-glutamyl-phosphate reductase [Dehalococcoidales bacterium]